MCAEASRMLKMHRLDAANILIREIASHGRCFFYSEQFDRIGQFELSVRVRIRFRDEYTNALIDTYSHHQGAWREFSHGGSLRSLIEYLRDYIRIGQKLPLHIIAPKHWGYDEQSAKRVQQKAIELGIIKEHTYAKTA